MVRPLTIPARPAEHKDAENEQPVEPTLPDALDIAQDGAEELSQLRSMLTSRRDFEKKRGVRGDGLDQVLEPRAAEKIERIMALAENGEITADALLRFAMSQFPDDSDLILVLRELVRRRRASELTRAKLQATLTQAEAQSDPKALKAGINVALKARLFGARMEASPSALRQSYRTFLTSLEQAPAQYHEWVERFGAERRALVVEFIESALFTDMHATDPSCSRLEFGELLLALRLVRLLRSSDERFIATMKPAWSFDEALSLRLLLAVLQQPYAPGEVLPEVLGDSLGQAPARERSVWLQALLRAFKSVPGDLFYLDEARDFVLDTLADLADQAYRSEIRGG